MILFIGGPVMFNVYIFIHEKHEMGSTITNSMVSVVLPKKTRINIYLRNM